MKKLFLLPPLLLLLVLTGCTEADVTQTETIAPEIIEVEEEMADTENLVEIEGEKDFAVNNVFYTNDIYGFGLTFPYTWEDYKVHRKKDDWGGGLMAQSFYFGFETWDDIFAISIMKKEDYEKVINVPSSVQLGKNEEYIFLGSQAQSITDKDLEARWGEVGTILDTFNLK